MFVDTIGTDDLKRSVLDATIAFGRESGMEMIAEGVENVRSRWTICSEHGVSSDPGLLSMPQTHAAEHS